MRERYFKIRSSSAFLLGVYLFLLLLLCGSLSVPPGDLPLDGLLFAIAVIGRFLARRESRRWRVTWNIGLALAVLLAALEVVAGRRLARQRKDFPSNLDSWDQYAHLLITNQPNRIDIVGKYRLSEQTITSNGLAAVNDRICELELHADGSFLVTNYPVWSVNKVDDFVSTNGHWKLDPVGIAGNQNAWGIRFADTDRRIDILEFIGTSAPYKLLFTYGDPDENRVMIYERVK